MRLETKFDGNKSARTGVSVNYYSQVFYALTNRHSGLTPFPRLFFVMQRRSNGPNRAAAVRPLPRTWFRPQTRRSFCRISSP